MKTFGKLIIAGGVVFAVLQEVRPSIPAKPATAELQARSTGGAAPAYTAGAVLALVTWMQRDDPHWIGARIPDPQRSVEFCRSRLQCRQAATGVLPALGSLRINQRPAQQRDGQPSLLGLAPPQLP